MKKQAFSVLVFLTCVFMAFTFGLLIGKNTAHEAIRISPINSTPIYANKTPQLPSEETLYDSDIVVFPININLASKEDLMALPGIGETLAQRILAYRMEHGSFLAVEELLSVPGIGTSKLEAILDLITTGGNEQ